MVTIEERRQIARDYLDGLGRFNFRDGLFSPDLQVWTSLSGDINGAVYLQRAGMLGQILQDGLKFTLHETTIEDNRVSIRCSSTGTMKTGEPYANDYHFLLHLDEQNRIVKFYEYMNVKTAFDQVVPAFKALQEKQAQLAK